MKTGKQKTIMCPHCGKRVRVVYAPSFRPMEPTRYANHKMLWCGERIPCPLSWHNVNPTSLPDEPHAKGGIGRSILAGYSDLSVLE